MRLAVIVDGEDVQRFALNALDAVTGTDEISLYSCTNTHIRKRWFRHAAYYALNLFTVRNRLTRTVPVACGKKRINRHRAFASEYDGVWQVLPTAIVEELNEFDVVLKFGMGLLRVPPLEELSTPILSYHHGDPDRYRGRPAGFWEMTENAPVMGQVVQVIGNRLDAGKIVASAETKVFPWSYRATLLEAYRHSPLIMDSAVRNAISGVFLSKRCEGRNCRLPSNLAVAGFVIRMTAQAIRRLLYGAFWEKAWQVSKARKSPEIASETLPPPGEWQTLPVASDYSFYADPFFSDQGVLVEALNRSSGLGEIVRIDEQGGRSLIVERGHISYPAAAKIAGREVVVPEVASWSGPRLYSLGRTGSKLIGQLRIEGGTRVSDPTLFERNRRIFLFGNDREAGSSVLHLWSSDSLEGEFRLHPASPIRISPGGSRMGGNLIEQNGRLYRLGQDFTRDYGDGLVLFEIGELSATSYSESLVRRIRFLDRKGPHTLNIRSDEIVFDPYLIAVPSDRKDRFDLS